MRHFKEYIERIAAEHLRFIAENRDALVSAWIAETGLKPSESILCEQLTHDETGKLVTRVWVEKAKR